MMSMLPSCLCDDCGREGGRACGRGSRRGAPAGIHGPATGFGAFAAGVVDDGRRLRRSSAPTGPLARLSSPPPPPAPRPATMTAPTSPAAAVPTWRSQPCFFGSCLGASASRAAAGFFVAGCGRSARAPAAGAGAALVISSRRRAAAEGGALEPAGGEVSARAATGGAALPRCCAAAAVGAADAAGTGAAAAAARLVNACVRDETGCFSGVASAASFESASARGVRATGPPEEVLPVAAEATPAEADEPVGPACSTRAAARTGSWLLLTLAGTAAGVAAGAAFAAGLASDAAAVPLGA